MLIKFIPRIYKNNSQIYYEEVKNKYLRDMKYAGIRKGSSINNIVEVVSEVSSLAKRILFTEFEEAEFDALKRNVLERLSDSNFCCKITGTRRSTTISRKYFTRS